MARFITVDGKDKEVKPEDGKRFKLGELQAYVDGYIEIISMPSGQVIYLNEEGKCDGLIKNELATKIWNEEFPIEKYPNNNDQLIVGNVLILSAKEDDAQNEEEICQELIQLLIVQRQWI